MKKTLQRLTSVLFSFAALLALASCASAKASEADSVPEKEETAGEVSTAGKRVYFAGPLFSQSELEYNLKLTKILEDHGYEVFLPQRDGYLAVDLEGKSAEEKVKMIFEKDVYETKKADIFFMILDGRVPDEGACVELGIAYDNGKRIYGFKTDPRAVESDMELNPMISGCFTKLFRNNNGEELIQELEAYLSEHEL